MKKILFTMHAGSGNHGCEAIVRSTCRMLEGMDVTVLSARPQEDERYSLRGRCRILPERRITEHLPVHAFYFLRRLLSGDPMCYIRYRYREALRGERYDAAVSVGGDNYCYPSQVADLMLLNRALQERGIATVLWGASIEPQLLEQPGVREDMRRYRHIFARESRTCRALLEAGLEEERVHCCPDPAFTLEAEERPLPPGFVPGNTVGVNVSPMVMEREEKSGIVLENYRVLIRHILEETDMAVALVPHVVWPENDDRVPLRALLRDFAGDGRVFLLEDGNCAELKGDIARLRFLVAARTHASIAAYSSGVPTLVTGYSVKAAGIAEDLFGEAERGVVPVQTLREPEQLWRAFRQMADQETAIRETLGRKMPDYIRQAQAGGSRLREALLR